MNLEDISVEITFYRSQENGKAHRGNFQMIIHPLELKILDMKYFKNEKGEWVNFPQKKINKATEAPKYIPLVFLKNKEIHSHIQKLIIAEIKKIEGSTPHEKKTFPYPAKTDPIPDDASDVWF